MRVVPLDIFGGLIVCLGGVFTVFRASLLKTRKRRTLLLRDTRNLQDARYEEEIPAFLAGPLNGSNLVSGPARKFLVGH